MENIKTGSAAAATLMTLDRVEREKIIFVSRTPETSVADTKAKARLRKANKAARAARRHNRN